MRYPDLALRVNTLTFYRYQVIAILPRDQEVLLPDRNIKELKMNAVSKNKKVGFTT